MGSEQLMSPADVAELLAVPVATIYQWRYTGYGPPGMRLGRHVRYRRVDVDRWIEDQLAREARSTRSLAATGVGS